MKITYRRYKDINDYKLICEFLEENYLFYGTRYYDNVNLFEFQCALARGEDGNIKEIDEALKDIFLWFNDDKLIAILDIETFCIAPDYRYVLNDMIGAREKFFSEEDIEWGIFDGDEDFENILRNKGYYKTKEYWVNRDIDCSTIENYSAKLPDGFYVGLISDLKDNDKDRVYDAFKLCYGILFNETILKNFYETSTYRKELDIVIMSPEHGVVALCSSRYDEKNNMASIEAVSCYPEYRKKGIGKEMILYALNEMKKLGAKKATVFTAMPEEYPAPNRLYDSVGFEIVGNLYIWKKLK